MPQCVGKRLCLEFLAIGLGGGVLLAAQTCGPLPAPPPVKVMTAEQQGWLAQTIAQQMQTATVPVADPALTGELDAVLSRLVAKLPPLGFQPQVHLLASAGADAFVVTAGQIYITRPLIAMLRNEAELAGILAHELGHAYLQAPAAMWAQRWALDPSLNGYGDTQAAFDENYNHWLTWAERHDTKAAHADADEKGGQEAADAIAVELLQRAGYDPRALSAGFSRIADVQPNSGNWLTSLFGEKPPDAHRLDQMLADALATPAPCPATESMSEADFRMWQDRLAAYTRPPSVLLAPGLRDRQALAPMARPVREIRFSPNGKFLLTWDSGGIWLLTVNPFAVLFRIVEPDAQAPVFSPDSASVWFTTRDGRVEQWNIGSQHRTLIRQVVGSDQGCLAASVSPTGSAMACMRPDLGFQLLDIASGAVRYEIKPPSLSSFADFSHVSVGLDFSPDGRYLALKQLGQFGGMGIWDAGGGFVLDVASGTKVAMPGFLRAYMNPRFTWLSDSEILGTSDRFEQQWERLSFPAGKTEAKLSLGSSAFVPEAHGPYLIARPVNGNAAGVLDPATHKLLLVASNPALDGYDDLFASEGRSGTLYLVRKTLTSEKLDVVAKLELPATGLAPISFGAVSEDLRLLALSEPERGAVWDLHAHRMLATLDGFSGAAIEGANLLIHFRRTDNKKPFGVNNPPGFVAYDLARGNSRKLAPLPKNTQATLFGNFLGEWVMDQPSKPQFELVDPATGKLLWRRDFRTPALAVPLLQTSSLLFISGFKSKDAQNDLRTDPAWASRLAGVHDPDTALWFEQVSEPTGKIEHQLLLENAPAFEPNQCVVVGGHLYLIDGRGRTLAYDMATGAAQGVWTGSIDAVAAKTQLIALQTAPRGLELYHTGAAEPAEHYRFPSDIRYCDFSQDGRTMLVVTADEAAFVIALPAVGAPAGSGLQ